MHKKKIIKVNIMVGGEPPKVRNKELARPYYAYYCARCPLPLSFLQVLNDARCRPAFACDSVFAHKLFFCASILLYGMKGDFEQGNFRNRLDVNSDGNTSHSI